MDMQRFLRHLLSFQWRVRRAFPAAALDDMANAIRASEQRHEGEIRFVVEAALEPWALLRGLTPRERAIEVFSELRVWDTEYNNGVLIYVLFADHAVEIVADRGIHTQEAADTWDGICRQIETSFRRAAYRTGALEGIEAVANSLARHFPGRKPRANELPDEPVLL